MSAPTIDRRAQLLRKAAYWLADYASAFRTADEPGARQFRDKLRKLAAQCRKAARSSIEGG